MDSTEYLEHHGVIGQKWGVRRYQNKDGSLTAAGRRHVKQLEKKDAKWARKNYDKIYKEAYKQSKVEVNDYLENDLNKRMNMRNPSGSLNMNYVSNYNRKLAEVMNTKVGDIQAPSGRVVRFIAKRGAVGVHMGLMVDMADLDTVKRGVYNTGKVAYKQQVVGRV